MIIKTDCQKCGKKKVIKNLITLIPGCCSIETIGKGCHKCGWKPKD